MVFPPKIFMAVNGQALLTRRSRVPKGRAAGSNSRAKIDVSSAENILLYFRNTDVSEIMPENFLIKFFQ